MKPKRQVENKLRKEQYGFRNYKSVFDLIFADRLLKKLEFDKDAVSFY